MNRSRRLATALCLAAMLPLPAFAASDAADSAYWDYRIPRHHWSQWTAGIAGFANHADNSPPASYRTRSGLFGGQLRTVATGGYDSDPLFQSWLLDVTAFGERRHRELTQELPPQWQTGDESNRNLSQRFIGAYAVRAYPWAFPLGFTASTNQRLELEQRFDSYDNERTSPGIREHSLSSSSLGNWTYVGDLSLGTGLGRVRDVTPVYEAQVLEDRLLRSGALARPLSRPAMERLAALFTVQNDMGYAHGRPSKYFWDEVERVLIEDGVLVAGAMSLYDAHRILEPLTIRGRIQRSAGWFFGPAVWLSMLQRHSGTEYSYSYLLYQADTLAFASGGAGTFDDYLRDDRISTAVSAEYHHPPGPDWQFDVQQLTLIGESGVRVTSNSSASAMWVVTDRWLATAYVRHSVDWVGQGFERAPGFWAVQYGTDLSYFLEDRWALTLSGVEDQRSSSFGFTRGGSYSLGITYVISGLFEAPGLTAAMRPIPGGR